LPVQFLLVKTVTLFFEVLFWLIIARVIFSWFRPSRYVRWYYELNRTVFRLTEPFLAPIRNVLPPTGLVDFSPFIALILLRVVEGLLLKFIYLL